MTNSGGAVRVRGGMFKTGDLEMKTAEVSLASRDGWDGAEHDGMVGVTSKLQSFPLTSDDSCSHNASLICFFGKLS